MTTTSVYIASPEGSTGKSMIARGVIESLSSQFSSVGLFVPLVSSDTEAMAQSLLSLSGLTQNFDDVAGVRVEDMLANPDAALAAIVDRYGRIQESCEAVVILGSDYTSIAAATELEFNATIAANLDAPVLLVVSGRYRDAGEIKAVTSHAVSEFAETGTSVVAVIANRVETSELDDVKWALGELELPYSAAIPENALLAAPTVREQFEHLGATLWLGDESALDRESLNTIVAGMTLPHVLDHITEETSVILPSDRTDVLTGLLLSQSSHDFPRISAIYFVGGYDPDPTTRAMLEATNTTVPVGLVDDDSYTTASKLNRLASYQMNSARKHAEALRMYDENVDATQLHEALNVPRASLMTPRRFEYEIMQMARSNRKTIVLPEAEDPRILEAASIVLNRGVAEIILLGEADKVRAHATDLGFDISGARIHSMNDPELVDKFAATYAELRAHKGVTIEQAREKMTDPSYFATMMVHLGIADGMVSGATHTTANTIRPSLEFIKTKPGTKVVSGSFLMCLPDRVLVFADCAVNPNPTSEQLADIAISSAATARAFGIEPRVAMLSYSTGTSGAGADVDAVREATEILESRNPDFSVAGPIQFDAAIDPAVGQKKMPESDVAGRATVFIFPDLNTGNNTYKAVQRTADAIAIGPVLQGLNKPVNDLSRGALVDDIVNTVAITAIQAQE